MLLEDIDTLLEQHDVNYIRANFTLSQRSRIADHIVRKLSRAGFVYFAQAGPGELIKIGFSVNPEARMKRLPGERPDILRGVTPSLLGKMSAKFVDEEVFHRRFAHLRVSGEWFLPANDLLFCIATESTG